MTALEDREIEPLPPRRIVISTAPTAPDRLPLPAHSRCLESTPPAPIPSSPTTSIGRVLLTVITSLLLALLFGARGVVHAGEGMPDGPMRIITLRVGQTVLQATTALHLTWPWDQVEAALGRAPQPSVAPLLSSGAATPVPPVPPTPPTPPTPTPFPGFSPAWLARRHILPHGVRHRHRAILRRRHPRPAALPPLHPISRRYPLRVLVTGDSLVGYLGPILIDDLSHLAPVRGFVDTHNGTGLTRPDFVDWSVVARQQLAADNPDATVVMIGGNDFQNMTLPPNRFFQAGTPAWTREYQRRAEICMRIWTRGGRRRVYWLSMPPARDPAWAYDDAQINLASRRAAAQVPGAEFLDILGPITDHGHYSDFVSQNGQPTLIRESDGVHLNIAGSTIVAGEVLPIIKREWRLR